MPIINVTAEKILEIFIFTGIIAFCFLADTSNQFIAVVLLAINVYGLYKARKNWYAAYIFLFLLYANYSICFANYLHRLNTFFVIWADSEISHRGMLILLIFSIGLTLAIPAHMKKNDESEFGLTKNNKDNKIIVIGIYAILLFILIFGYTRPTIEGGRGSPSTYYEYSVILFILGFYYCGKSLRTKTLLSFLMALYAAQNFMFGGRITGLQIVICWAFCLYIDKLKIRYIVPLGFAFVVAMMTIGRMRGGVSFSIDEFKNTIEYAMRNGGALDTAYSSYYTSLTFLQVRDELSMLERLSLFGNWLLSILFGHVIPNSNLAYYTRIYYTHYYGGIIPFFGYFYLGYAGILLFVFLLAKMLRKVSQTDINSTGLARCITLYIVVTTPRWYLYSPSQITRGILIFSTFYGVCYWFDSRIRR